MDSDQVAAVLGQLTGQGIFGGFLGILPFLMARRRGRKTLGVVALIVCALFGFFLGPVIASIGAVVFAGVFLVLKKATPPSSGATI
jgi:hypothetical protein